MNYLFVLLSIIIYIFIAVIMVFIDNALILGSGFAYPDFHYIYVGIRTIFLLGGVLLIINQYYNIMKSGLRDYYNMKKPGVTKNNFRILILIQVLFLILTTVPIGLFGGYQLTGMLLNSMGSFSIDSRMKELINSINTFYIMSGAASCSIILTGIYLERGIRKLPLSSVLSDNQ